MKKYILSVLFIGLAVQLSSCSSGTKEEKIEKKPVKINQVINGKKEGLHVAKQKDGRLKWEINYKEGKRHGICKDYYESGKMRSKIEYKDGVKDGKAFWYFDGVNVYRENEYKNNELHGIQTKYYKDGTKMSILEYHEDYPGLGLQEWKEKGGEIKSSVKIILERKGNKVLVKLDPPLTKAIIYYGELTEGKFLNNRLYEITTGPGEAELRKSLVRDLKNVTITARYPTYLKNPRIISVTKSWSEI
jgi:antitoxin component YwqK of YwqJK toxin-antitoxin module